MAHIGRQYIFRAFQVAATAAYGTCTFYPIDWEPDITSVNRWASINMLVTSDPMREGDHVASGRFVVTINARKSLNDIYAAMKIADTLTSTFRNGYFSVTAAASPVGNLITRDPSSQALDLSDGILSHHWECEFVVYEA